MSLFKHDPTSIVTPEQFERYVLRACAKFGWPADLPEIEYFMSEASSYLASGYSQPQSIDQLLDPSALVHITPDGDLVIPVHHTTILAPLTLARHFYPNLTTRLTNLMADDSGLYLWSRGMHLATIKAGAIDPQRRDDYGKLAYVDVCGMIHELTGLYPRWERHFGRTTIIAAERLHTRWYLGYQFPGGFLRVVTA